MKYDIKIKENKAKEKGKMINLINIVKLIVLVFVSFKTFQIITNNNKKISIMGSILIGVSSFVTWTFKVNTIIFGEIVIIAIEKFMKADKIKFKIGWSLAFTVASVLYILTSEIAYIVSFGYVFLALAIWLVLKNLKEYKFNKTDLFFIIIAILVITIFIILNPISEKNTVTGGKGVSYLFSYGYSYVLPFVETENNIAYSSFLSFFPIPILMAMIYIYKEEKHIKFIFPILIVLVVESIWCMSGFPNILSKITLFNLVPVEKCAISVGLGCIYLYIYMISNIKENFISLKTSAKIALIILVLFFFADRPDILENSRGYMYLFSSIVTMGYFLSLNSIHKRYTNVFLWIAIIWTLVSSVPVLFI